MLEIDYDGYDPEQRIYLLKPGFNPQSVSYDDDCIDFMYFQTAVANKLEADGFLSETYEQLNAFFDWGDCDVFELDRCIKFKEYLIKKLDRKDLDSDLVKIYTQMLDFTNRAIELKSGLYFDFV